MKNFLNSLVLASLVLSSTLYSPKADALVGVIFKNKIVKTIGAVGAIGGGALSAGGLVAAAAFGSYGGLVALIFGAGIGGIGLIVLDDHQLADIEFRPINLNNPSDYKGFTALEVAIYNSEVEMLNSIRQTILSEVDDSDDTAVAEELWNIYAQNLSPETFNVAKARARVFVEKL